MKKIICGFFAVLLAACMAACGSADITSVSDNTDTSSVYNSDITSAADSSATDNHETAEKPVTDTSEIENSTPLPDDTDNHETAEKPVTDTSEIENSTSLPDDINNHETENTAAIDEHGTYTTKEDVALYIHTYNKLPENFITKNEAQALGWSGGGLENYAPGKCIGGSYFGNYEQLLPTKKGREYHECDIDTLGAKSRGAKRIVYSNDGLIYYTEDHYASFELLYGEE